jgi:NAD(P)-dependent dehydrogenase (short-subunit alcohol dehydrogenase family)
MRMSAEGGRSVVVDLNDDHGRGTVETITKTGGAAMFVKADVGNPNDIQAAVDAAVGKWKRIDVLVNNAAMMTFKPVVELSVAEWDKVLAVNLRSVFVFCKYAIPHMPAGSAIVNTSSVHAHQTTPNVSPYVASKGGLEAFCRCLALELRDRKIRINCVAPGAVDTPMLWNNPMVKGGREHIQGAVGEPEDIASAICYLASSEARYINGQTLVVDGGRLDIL